MQSAYESEATSCQFSKTVQILQDHPGFVINQLCFESNILQGTHSRQYSIRGQKDSRLIPQAKYKFYYLDIAIILDYCAEGEIGSPEFEVTLDENAKMFARSA